MNEWEWAKSPGKRKAVIVLALLPFVMTLVAGAVGELDEAWGWYVLCWAGIPLAIRWNPAWSAQLREGLAFYAGGLPGLLILRWWKRPKDTK